jgi:predicted nucleotidyltransferase
MVSESDIRALCREIAAEIRARRIVLFGSYAWGTPTADSDVDLLIVASLRGRPAGHAAALRAKLRTRFPVDLVLRTPRAVKERLALGDPFIGRILREGKTMYESTR